MTVVAITLAYLAGCVPTGVLLTRRLGIDVRHVGSGNIGATNVTRAAGRRIGALTLLGDAAKGALPVWIGASVGASPTLAAAIGIAAVLGHTYPVTLGFRGGKGVATALGVLAVLDPVAAIVSVLVFTITVATTRHVSVGSLVGVGTAPVVMLLAGSPRPAVIGMATIGAIVLLRHRDNLTRLLAGTEPRL